MIFDEINDLLSNELELLKEVRSYEAKYLHKLERLELTKEKVRKKNKDAAEKEIEEIRKKELKKTEKEIDKQNKRFRDKKASIKNSYSKKKDKILDMFLETMQKEVENAYSKEAV